MLWFEIHLRVKKIKFHVILEQLRNFCDITGFHVANVVSLCVYFTDVLITVKLNLLQAYLSQDIQDSICFADRTEGKKNSFFQITWLEILEL